jgi:hypothetical protein
MPAFQNTLFHLNRPTRLWRWNRQCSEMLAFKPQMPGNNPEESIWHSKHGESLKSKKVSETCSIMWFTQLSLGCDRSKCLSGWFSFWCWASSMRSIQPESLGWFQQEVHYCVTMPTSFFPISSTNAANVLDNVETRLYGTCASDCYTLSSNQLPVTIGTTCQSFFLNPLSCPWFQMNELGCISGLPHRESYIIPKYQIKMAVNMRWGTLQHYPGGQRSIC